MTSKILIIEDDIFSANTYQYHLHKAGFQTQIAPDGATALKLFDSFQPNLIILDLILPRIDGFTLLHFFKKIPVIIISNLDQEDIPNTNQFISKSSLNYEKLITEIKKII